MVSIDSEALPVPRQLMRSTRSVSSNAITSIPKQSRTVTDQHSFFISVCHTWNILPAELCTSYISLASFNYYSTHDSTLIMISMKAHCIQGLFLLYIVILEVYMVTMIILFICCPNYSFLFQSLDSQKPSL